MIGETILKYRAPIGAILLLVTGFFGYEASRVRVATAFVDFFPRNHAYVQLYRNYARYGGAQSLTLMVKVNKGDIFNRRTLEKIQNITFDLDLLPGIYHQSIRSLASYRLTYVTALPGNLVSKNVYVPGGADD